ncbi:hypothetical protein [Paraburkholderia dinghuensis]|uniref:DUF4148 domain-containing protein n=1 Tax=Paraburkholderia dinghuensis TaxID=2305225 RepID=A0A3N6NED0_9BURK|nr:hypothetical protein [Paraburkholderia dinghuensis]RQH07372.1 hypothetical protein D1Y85_08250 [Paraburkholderia dinghuensis]
MKGGGRPTMRLTMIALAFAGGVVAALDPVTASAQPSADRPRPISHSAGYKPSAQRSHNDPPGRPASDPNPRTPGVPPDLDERRRDGHMTPEERHLLRQHIEDAVRELYRR